MGYAAITNSLGKGRYRIKLDTGESRRVALLNAANQALAIAGAKVTAAYEQVLLADALEAESAASIAALIDSLIAESDPTAVELARRVLALKQKEHAKLVASHQPARLQYSALKDTQADLIRQRAAWESLQTITYKEAWCTTYTEGAAGEFVATIDIPGDTSLTLLAPGCRQARNGDGTISSNRKAAALSRRTNELTAANKQLTELDDTLVTARAAEVTLRGEVTAAQANYVALPTNANYAIFEAKTAELAAKRHEIANLTVSRQVVMATIARLNQEIAYWSARPASETPYAGDGALRERALLSPAQTFFNAAIFPGWQKWMPTYRWATITNIDYDANKLNATLVDSQSTAQRLNVNQTTSISSVDVEYADSDSECDCRAFGAGDRVVVEFANQNWSNPKVIGYLDNPRPCPPKATGTIGAKIFFIGAAGVSLATNFIGGADPLTFTIIEGVLPPGVSLNSTSGVLSYSGGRVSEEITENVKVRCHDTFYEVGNRRYDESNTFSVTVKSAWTDVSGSATGNGSFGFGPVGVSRVEIVFTAGEGRAYYSGGGSAGGTPLYYEVFKSVTDSVYAPLYVRRTLISEEAWDPTGTPAVEDGVWYLRGSGSAPPYLEEAIYSLDAVGTKHGICRIDYAIAPNESSILCSITADLTANTGP